MANAPQQTAPHPAQFYRLPHLKKKFQVSGSSIWAWVKKGTFPKPYHLSSNCTAWSAADVEAWAQSRIDAAQAVK